MLVSQMIVFVALIVVIVPVVIVSLLVLSIKCYSKNQKYMLSEMKIFVSKRIEMKEERYLYIFASKFSYRYTYRMI